MLKKNVSEEQAEVEKEEDVDMQAEDNMEEA